MSLKLPLERAHIVKELDSLEKNFLYRKVVGDCRPIVMAVFDTCAAALLAIEELKEKVTALEVENETRQK